MDQPTRIADCSAAILVGGESRRMGTPKALLDIAGEPLYARIAFAIAPYFDEVVLVGDLPEHVAPSTIVGLRRVPDELPQRSSLNGIATALRMSSSEWVAIFACDAPQICLPLLVRMSNLRGDDVDVVLATDDEGFAQPFHALWRSGISTVAASAAECGELSVRRLLSRLRVEAISPQIWRHDDPSGVFLANLNTVEDYAAYVARQRIDNAPGVSPVPFTSSHLRCTPYRR